MKKTTPFHRYETSVTFVRVNLPHHGHVELVQKMLAHGDQAYVYVSTGRANNDWDLRVLLLTHLCREAGLDLNRVNFMKASNPFEAVQGALNESPWEESVIVLGEDQGVMARKLSETFDCPFLLNRRSNSSTQMRFFLDQEGFIEDLRHLYRGDEFACTIAKVLRKEEINRENTLQSARASALCAS